MVSYKILRAMAVGSVLTALTGGIIGETANSGRRSLPRSADYETLERHTEYVKKEINGWYVLGAGVLLGAVTAVISMGKSSLDDRAAAKTDELKDIFG